MPNQSINASVYRVGADWFVSIQCHSPKFSLRWDKWVRTWCTLDSKSATVIQQGRLRTSMKKHNSLKMKHLRMQNSSL